MAKTYYVTWPDRVTTLLIVGPGGDGRDDVRMAGRRERFRVALGEKPFPTDEAEIQALALKMGARVKKH